MRLRIVGQPQNVGGPVVCSTTDGKFSIAIGAVITGVIMGLEPDGSVVHNVGLGTVNSVVMGFTKGVPGENASATKNGNTCQITGTASGVDNAGQQVRWRYRESALLAFGDDTMAPTARGGDDRGSG